MYYLFARSEKQNQQHILCAVFQGSLRLGDSSGNEKLLVPAAQHKKDLENSSCEALKNTKSVLICNTPDLFPFLFFTLSNLFESRKRLMRTIYYS